MTANRDGLRALSLAGLVVVSALAATVAVTGPAAAANDEPSVLKVVEDGQYDGIGDEEITVVFDDQVVAADTTDSLDEAGDGFFTLRVRQAGNGTTDEIPVEESAVTAAGEGDGSSGSPTGEFARYEIDLASVSGLDETDFTPADDVTLEVGAVEPAGSADPDAYEVDPGRVPVDLTTKKIVDGSAAHNSRRSSLRVYRGEQVLFETDSDDSDVVLRNLDTGGIVLDGSTGLYSEEVVFDTRSLEAGTTYRLTFEGSGDRQYFTVNRLDLSAAIRPNGESFAYNDTQLFALSGSAVRGRKNGQLQEVAYHVDGDSDRYGRLEYTGKATFRERLVYGQRLNASGYTVTVTDVETGIEVTAGSFTVEPYPTADSASLGPTPVEDRGDVVDIPVELDDSEDGAQATVAIGSTGRTNYVTNVTVADEDGDGEVVLEFNTFLAGVSGASDEYPAGTWNDGELEGLRDRVFTAEGVDTVSSWRGERGEFVDDLRAASGGYSTNASAKVATIDAGVYELRVAANNRSDFEDGFNFTDEGATAGDLGRLTLRARTTERSGVWVVPADFEGEVDFGFVDENLDATGDAVDGNLTRSDQATAGELVVHRVSASGLEGPIRNRTRSPGVNATVAFLNELNASATSADFSPTFNTFNASFREDNPGPNAAAERFDLDTSNFTLVPDYDNDTYYLVVDLAAVEQDRLADGQDWAATFGFERYESFGPVVGGDGAGVVASTWTYLEPDATLETTQRDLVVVRNLDDQRVTGRTNVAPGTELTVRVESLADAGAFLETFEVRVDENRTFAETTDFFADETAGVGLTAEVFRGDESISDEFDGRVLGTATGTVALGNQTVAGQRQEVVVDSVTLSEGGFVALRRGNLTGPVLGTSGKLAPGEHANVRVDVDDPVEGPASVVAIAHLDTDGDNVYGFERGGLRDRPYVARGAPVSDAAVVSPATPTPTVTPTPTPDVPTATADGTPTATPTASPPTATPPSTATPTTPLADSPAPTTTSADGPGPGVAVSLVALLAALLAAVRRRT